MIILYTTDDGKCQIQLRTKDQTDWLTQRDMAELFAVSTDNIGLHLKNIFEDAELSREDIIEAFNLPPRTIEAAVKRLLEHQFIERIGSGRSTRYRCIGANSKSA